MASKKKPKGQKGKRKSESKRPPGRPSSFNQKTADKICELLIEGHSLRDICKRPGMPNPSTMFRWMEEHEQFRKQYARARSLQAEILADDIVAVADKPLLGRKTKRSRDGVEVITGDCVERSKLMVDARKWVAAKLLPKKYGARPDVAEKIEEERQALFGELDAAADSVKRGDS